MVAAWRQARDRARAGLEPAELPAFRAELLRIVAEIDAILQRAGHPIEAFPRPTREAYHELRRLAEGPIATRAASPPTEGRPARGRHHDLNASFDRVNAAYFEGQMARPRLAWGRRPTRRRLASYSPLGDLVRFSPSLDRPDLPAWFIDFVMYHELLHKQLGAEERGDRRYVHTPAFRRAERRFARYDEARALLERIGALLD